MGESESICRFIPVKRQDEGINALNFVYETEFSKIQKNFLRSAYMLHIVTDGSAELVMGENTYPLKKGDVFLAFSAIPYSITRDCGFRYMYITFIGVRVRTLFEELGISRSKPVYTELGHLLPFWENSIRMMQPANANILAESVLLHTLSHMCAGRSQEKENTEDFPSALAEIKAYVDSHYTDIDLNLKSLARRFSYNEKYLSTMFKKNVGTAFSDYLRDMRIQRACQLMDEGMTVLSEVAAMSGFKDPLYFSKVFKNKMERSPSEHMKLRK